MFTYCVWRSVLQIRLQNHYSRCALQLSRAHSTQETELDLTSILLKLCADRSFIAPGEYHTRALRHGNSCGYGPLGKDLKTNILDQWWNSVTRSKTQVFGIDTLQHVPSAPESLKLVDASAIGHIINSKDLTKGQLVDKLQELLRHSSSVRTNLLQGEYQYIAWACTAVSLFELWRWCGLSWSPDFVVASGALEQYPSSLELVNRKLPFGLAETGTCHQLSDQNQAAIGWWGEQTFHLFLLVFDFLIFKCITLSLFN